MSDYKGFRIWPLEFQAMTSSTPGVDTSEMSNGRLSIPSTGARFWTCNDVGLKAYLEDFLQPMWDGSNGVGWSLDTDLYERLNSLDSSSKDARTFKEFNPNTFYTNSNPTGEKTVKLVPTTYCRAMFFKHTSGYRAMIGLSLYAMDLNNYISKFYEYSTAIGNIADPGFICRHVYAEFSEESYNNCYTATGGLFIAMIPPANDGDSQDEWLPEFSINDERFYPSTMSPIVPMMHTFWRYGSSADQYYSGSCWLKTGTSTAYNSTSAGVLVGTNMKTCLLLDSKGNVGLTYKYTGTSNTTSLLPMIFVGPLYSESLASNDTLCTRKFAIMTINIGGRSSSFSGASVSSYRQAAWISADGATYYSARFYSITDDFYNIGYISSNGRSHGNTAVYTAYPALDSSVLTNYRYAKAGYINARLIDEEVIRWSSVSGLVEGQTYNDGQWICLPYTYSLRAQNGTTSNWYLWPQLRWDSDFNDTKTFS